MELLRTKSNRVITALVATVALNGCGQELSAETINAIEDMHLQNRDSVITAGNKCPTTNFHTDMMRVVVGTVIGEGERTGEGSIFTATSTADSLQRVYDCSTIDSDGDMQPDRLIIENRGS